MRVLAEFLGGDLVDRDAGVDAGAFGLLGMDAGEPGGARARMIAGAVAERPAVDLGQPVRTSMRSRNGSSGFMVRVNSKPVPFGRGRPAAMIMPSGR